jgi:hypothetical protein
MMFILKFMYDNSKKISIIHLKFSSKKKKYYIINIYINTNVIYIYKIKTNMYLFIFHYYIIN